MQTELLKMGALVPMSLKQSAIDDQTAQVINQSREHIADPLERYARLRVLKAIVDKAVEETGASAEYFCEQHNLGSDGNDFIYKGMIFRRQFVLDYRYSENATDLNGNPLPYKQTLQSIEKLKKQLELQKKLLKGYEGQIEHAHPNMVPDVVRVVLTYRGLNPKEL